MTIDVTAPDGSSVSFPDGTDAQTIDRVMSENFGRGAGPSESQTWGGYLRGLGREAIQGATFDFADELGITDHTASQRFASENPIASTTARVAGSIAPFLIPATAPLQLGRLAQAARWATSAPSMAGNIGRSVVLGAPLAGATTIGAGEGDIGQRLENLPAGLTVGAGISAAAPPAARAIGAAVRGVGDVISPALARARGSFGPRPPSPPIEGATPISARPQQPISGATFVDDAQGVAVGPGANAQADQMLANEVMRSGHSTVEPIRAAIAANNRARTFNPGSQAPSAATLAEYLPGWRRMLGSATRASTEPAETAERFFLARQTGRTPAGGRPLHEGAGIPTREPMAPKVKGSDMPETGVAQDRFVSMSQRERLSEGMRRSLLIMDDEHHGHLPSAHRTRLAIEKEGKAESDRLYAHMREVSKGYNPGKHIQPIIDRVKTVIDNPDTGRTEAELLQKGLDEFYRNGRLVSSVDGFDQAQRALRALYEGANSNVRRVQGGLRRQLVDAVDAIEERGIGAAYQAARRSHFDTRRANEAFMAGREGAKEGAEVGADSYLSLPGPDTGPAATLKKLYRLGYWQHMDERMAALKPTDDVTNIFKGRDYDLLEAIVPRSAKATAEYADRPQRLGRFIEMERRFPQTAQKTRGGSPTQERKRDDEAYDVMYQAISGLRNLGDMGLRVVARILNRIFGYQADTSQAITTKLLSADPAAINQTLAGIEARMGKNRFELFARLLAEYQGRLAAASAQSSGGLLAPIPQSSGPSRPTLL